LGFAGVVSLVGVVPPALDLDVPDPEEELVVEEPDTLEAPVDLTLEEAVVAPGKGVKGLRAVPPCCLEVPLVVSETGRLGLTGAWLTTTPGAREEAPDGEEAATGVADVEEPPLSTA
jgi:hypothetical protein